MAKLTFREAASVGGMKKLIDLISSDLVELPKSTNELCESLRIASGMTRLNSMVTEKTNMDKMVEFVCNRLNDSFGNWIYKSDLLNQASRRKYFQTMLHSKSGVTEESILADALGESGLKTETSEDGKQIRLVVERKTYETDFSKEYDPDMDF